MTFAQTVVLTFRHQLLICQVQAADFSKIILCVMATDSSVLASD